MSGIWVALAVFLFTYFLISIRRLPRIRLDRPIAALLGAALMILFGVVAPQRALESIDLDIIFLLLGMMLLVVALELCGLFEWVSLRMVRYASTQFRLLLIIMLASAILSALVLNDAVVLMFTPVVIRACHLVRTDPVPFLVGEAVAANIGSVATVVGNPQNAYIATKAGIGFLEFSAVLLPIAAISLALGVALIYIRSLIGENGSGFQELLMKTNMGMMAGIDRLRKRRRALMVILTITFLAVLGFSLSNFIGVPLSMVAFIAGVAAFLTLLLLTDVRGREVLRGVDWSILLFFVGLFIVLQGVIDSGLLAEIQALFPGFGEGETPTLGTLTFFSAVLSNLVSNVPAVMLLGEMIPANDVGLWLALAANC